VKFLGINVLCTLGDLILRVLHYIVTNSFGYLLNGFFVVDFTVVVLNCFVMCGCVYVWVLKYVYLYIHCVFVFFRLYIFFLIFFVCTNVRTTVTG
jgi:hypothetical protein